MNLSKQKIIIIDGPMGSGKTTTANLLYKKFKYTAFLGLDRIKWFVSEFPRTYKANQMTAKVILAMCECYLNCGMTVVIEQSFRKKSVMKPYLDISKKKNIPILVYELTAPKEILIDRVKHRVNICPVKKKLPFWRRLLNINAYPHKPFAPVRLMFDSSKLSAGQIVNQIIKDIKAA